MDKPLQVENITDLPWFNVALEHAHEVMKATPEYSWPSWYREHRTAHS